MFLGINCTPDLELLFSVNKCLLVLRLGLILKRLSMIIIPLFKSQWP